MYFVFSWCYSNNNSKYMLNILTDYKLCLKNAPPYSDDNSVKS